MGHEVSANTVRKLLEESSATRASPTARRTKARSHPDRNAQFEHINAKVVAAQAAGQPVISVDTKKKELVGNFKNGGSDYRPEGRSASRQGARLRGQGARQGRALRRLRRRPPTPAGSASGSRRHGRVRRQVDPPLARADGTPALSAHARADDHGRRRRLQRRACPAVEGRAAEARRRDAGSRSASTTTRRARPSGTRSSTACSATSRRTGAAGRCGAGWRWSS